VGKRVLDLACGEGRVARLLAGRGARVTGVDLSTGLLDHARKQSPEGSIDYVRDDAQSLSRVGDGTMDAVVCHMALMDIADLSSAFASVRRVLTPGGTFVLCILHPCLFTPFHVTDAPPAEVDSDGRFVALRTTRYSVERKWYSGGTGMCGTLGAHHRMLSTYLNALVTSGLTLVRMVEPVLPDGDPGSCSQPQQDRIVPTVMIVKASAAAPM